MTTEEQKKFETAHAEELRKRAEQQKRIERIFGNVVPILCLLLLSGCASFVSTVSEGHPNRTTITVPPGSTVIMLDGGRIIDADEDGHVEIHRGAGAFRSNAGRVENKGVMIGIVRRGVTPWILGNFIPYNGVLLGMIVDFTGGGAFDPKYVPIESDASILKAMEEAAKDIPDNKP
jgi:hypothetical protein